MTSITEPSKFVTPFAESGLKNAIPPASNNTTGKAGFDKGFPERTMLPKASGGIPPSGMDFNGILYDITSAIRYMQAGGRPTYDAAFAAAIGGYPSGAVLIGDDGVSVFQNAVAGNETDPNSGGAGWTRPDLQVMELYRRSYAADGLYLAGSFEEGVTVTKVTELVLHEASGKAYSWIGSYPPGGLVVPADSSPSAGWIAVDPKYKASVTPEMFASDGADDTTIIKRARNFIMAMGGGTLTLTREYVVGKQVVNPSPSSSAPYWQSVDADFLTFNGLKGVNVYFNQGASLKFNNGLRYGSFDPLTGAVYNPPAGIFTNPAYVASPGDMVSFTDCLNSTVRNPKLRGNMDNLVIGGRWGDKDIQLSSIGVKSVRSVNTTIYAPDILDMPLDGLYATGNMDQWINFVVYGGISDRSGRQGFSWVGGDGVFFYGTTLTRTGKGPVSSAPKSGIDIEDNGTGCKFGRFYDCKIYGNEGSQVLTLVTTDNIRFINSDIAGDNGTAVWANSNGIEFHLCNIYGKVVNVASNLFKDCYFTNKLYQGSGVGSPLFMDIASPATIDGGVIDNYHPSSYGFNLSGGVKLVGVEFRFSATDPVPRSRVGIIGNAFLTDCKFKQNYNFVSSSESAIAVSGEYTFVESTIPESQWEGKNTIQGSCLAWGGRTGSINFILNQLKQATYTDQITYTCVGAGPSFTIPMPRTGSYIVSLYKTGGNATLRNTKAVWIVCSLTSSSASNHSFNKIASINNTLGGGGSVEMAISSGADAIVLTQGTIPLDGETWGVRISSMDQALIPL